MASLVDATGNPIPTSSVLMPEQKYGVPPVRKVGSESGKCIDKPNPEVNRCAFGLLKDLHQSCAKEMDAYAGCMYYNTNEFKMCRK